MVEDQARKEPVLLFGRRCLRFYELFFDPARAQQLFSPLYSSRLATFDIPSPRFLTIDRTNSSFLHLRYPFPPSFLSVPYCSFLFVDRALSPSRILSLDHRTTRTNESRGPIVGVSNFDLRGSGLNHKTALPDFGHFASATAWKITSRRCSLSGSFTSSSSSRSSSFSLPFLGTR